MNVKNLYVLFIFTLLIGTGSAHSETLINDLRVTGERSQLNIQTQANFVNGVFVTDSEKNEVQLRCLKSGTEILRPGPYEPENCGNLPMADMKFIEPAKTAFFLARSFGISQSQAYGYNAPGSSAANALQAFSLSTDEVNTAQGLLNVHQWTFDSSTLNDKLLFKAPGTGPHIHLGIKHKKGAEPLFFQSGQTAMSFRTGLKVAEFQRTNSAANSFLTFAVEILQKKKNKSEYLHFTFIVNVFNPNYNGYTQPKVSSDGRNAFIFSHLHSSSPYLASARGETQRAAFSDFKTFEFSITKEIMEKMLTDLNQYLVSIGRETDVVLTSAANFGTLKFRGISLRNENTDLYGADLKIHVQVDYLKAVRVLSN